LQELLLRYLHKNSIAVLIDIGIECEGIDVFGKSDWRRPGFWDHFLSRLARRIHKVLVRAQSPYDCSGISTAGLQSGSLSKGIRAFHGVRWENQLWEWILLLIIRCVDVKALLGSDKETALTSGVDGEAIDVAPSGRRKTEVRGAVSGRRGFRSGVYSRLLSSTRWPKLYIPATRSPARRPRQLVIDPASAS
jgi:hypothetical protein